MTAESAGRDAVIRSAAFLYVKSTLQTKGYLTAEDLSNGITLGGERIPLVNPRRGIFKPRQMRHVLSIRTVYPKPGNRVWYDDQRAVHQQIYSGDDSIDYSFRGSDPESYDNIWLREAYEDQTPIIYFVGAAPGRYQAIFPTFVRDWFPSRLSVSGVRRS